MLASLYYPPPLMVDALIVSNDWDSIMNTIRALTYLERKVGQGDWHRKKEYFDKLI